MADSADPIPETGNSTAHGSERGSAYRTPRWVKVFGFIAIGVLLLIAVLLLTGGDGGGHGPSRHGSSGSVGGQHPAGAGHSPP